MSVETATAFGEIPGAPEMRHEEVIWEMSAQDGG